MSTPHLPMAGGVAQHRCRPRMRGAAALGRDCRLRCRSRGARWVRARGSCARPHLDHQVLDVHALNGRAEVNGEPPLAAAQLAQEARQRHRVACGQGTARTDSAHARARTLVPAACNQPALPKQQTSALDRDARSFAGGRQTHGATTVECDGLLQREQAAPALTELEVHLPSAQQRVARAEVKDGLRGLQSEWAGRRATAAPRAHERRDGRAQPTEGHRKRTPLPCSPLLPTHVTPTLVPWSNEASQGTWGGGGAHLGLGLAHVGGADVANDVHVVERVRALGQLGLEVLHPRGGQATPPQP